MRLKISDQHKHAPVTTEVDKVGDFVRIILTYEANGRNVITLLKPDQVRTLATELKLFADEVEQATKKHATKDVTAFTIIESLGFEKRETGGGHSALYFERPDGEVCEIVDGEDGLAPVGITQGWDIRFYRNEQEVPYRSESFPDGKIAAINLLAEWRVG